jgi:transcriptional regulator with XRE-family HTH domain
MITETVRGPMSLKRDRLFHPPQRSSIPGIGIRIRARRIALGWSQEDMEAELRTRGLSISRGKLSNYETTRQMPTLKTVMVFAQALGCTIDSLVHGDAP